MVLEEKELSKIKEALETPKKQTKESYGKSKKITKVSDLGLYREAIEFIGKYHSALSEEVTTVLKDGVLNISWGFYSFHKSEKVHFFKKARLEFVKALTLIHLINFEKKNKNTEIVLDGSIIAGISGLIKKHETTSRH